MSTATETPRDRDRADARLADYYVTLEEIGMGDVALEGAEPMNLKAAQSLIYGAKRVTTFRAASLVREREFTQRIAVFYVSRADYLCILLIRNGDEDEGDGRTYYVTHHADLLEELPQLVENHGFEFSSIRGDYLLEDLPEQFTAPFVDEEDGDAEEFTASTEQDEEATEDTFHFTDASEPPSG